MKTFTNQHTSNEKKNLDQIAPDAQTNIDTINHFKEIVEEVKNDVQTANHQVMHMEFDVHSLLKEYTHALTNIDMAVDDQMRLLNLLTEIEVLVKKAIDADDKQQVADIFKMVNGKNLEDLIFFKIGNI